MVMDSGKAYYASIFNDVLAPVTQGPSRTKTVGPFRIGTIARSILKGEPKKIKVKMSTKGGYFATFYNFSSKKNTTLLSEYDLIIRFINITSDSIE